MTEAPGENTWHLICNIHTTRQYFNIFISYSKQIQSLYMLTNHLCQQPKKTSKLIYI